MVQSKIKPLGVNPKIFSGIEKKIESQLHDLGSPNWSVNQAGQIKNCAVEFRELTHKAPPLPQKCNVEWENLCESPNSWSRTPRRVEYEEEEEEEEKWREPAYKYYEGVSG